jgi:resuscitation-promoting factor RpfA
MQLRAHRAVPFIRAGIFIAGIAALLRWATGSPARTWHTLLATAGGSAATTNVDRLIGSSAALAAWIGLGWLSAAFVLEVASVLPGAVGRGGEAIATHVSPTLMRRLVQAAIGVSVLAGPLTAGSALASGPSTTTSTSVDRPSSVAGSLVPGPLADSRPVPLALDRPATAFVPSSPPPAAKLTRPGPAALVTGVAHRDDASDPRDPSTRGYVVRRGDTLWDIAARHLGPGATSVDISREWPAWYDANRAVIGPDPGVIRPGEVLSPPSASTSSVGTR